jgi:hypothetical protein
MKKLLLTIILSVFALSGCSMVYSTPQYGEPYEADFAYLDRYELVNWNAAEYGAIQYSYYDYDRVFIVIYGNRIYIIPYEYFYRYIEPYFRGRIIWRSYDYLANYWGYHYYNNLWNYWYYRHHHPYWRPHRDWYFHHKRTNRNDRIVIRKNEIDGHRPVRPPVYTPKPNSTSGERRVYTPRHNSTSGERRVYTPNSSARSRSSSGTQNNRAVRKKK